MFLRNFSIRSPCDAVPHPAAPQLCPQIVTVLLATAKVFCILLYKSVNKHNNILKYKIR